MNDSDRARFWSKVDQNGPVMPRMDTRCWVWTGGKSRVPNTDDYYGRFWLADKTLLPHRVSFLWTHGSLPDIALFTINHLCHNTLCVRPDHLEAATRRRQAEHRKGAQRNSKSGKRGVLWHKRDQKWEARVIHKGKIHHAGYHDDIDDAANAAEKLRLKLHGKGELSGA